MKVKELIKELKNFENNFGERDVIITDGHRYSSINLIEVSNEGLYDNNVIIKCYY